MDYQQYIRDDMARTVEQIRKGFTGIDDWKDVDLTAACHLYVKNNVDYEVRGRNPRRPFRPAHEVLEDQAGNCQEQTVLLVSLLNAVPDIEVRCVWVETPAETMYMLPEIKYFTERTGYMGLFNFYKNTEHCSEDATNFAQDNFNTEDEEKAYFPADPSSGEYIGDISWLAKNDIIEVMKGDAEGPKDWKWNSEPVFRKVISSWSE